MQRFSLRFSTGFLAGLALAVVLNVLPHLWMRFNDVKDGYDTFGFPFVFHREGGFVWICEFHWPALLLDAALALVFAFGIGRACARRHRRLT
jgi:hypothetical protein